MPSQEELEHSQDRRRKRCYHRVISGLEKGGDLRLITLTSSDQAPSDIQRSFRKLIMRLRRRQLCQDYIKVIETKDDGREHIHMCFRGSYIQQAMLSAFWMATHQSPVVDIRQVKKGYRNKRGVAGYLAKYMAKEISRRYSWSWGWVYKGFVKTWTQAKVMIYCRVPEYLKAKAWAALLALWRAHVKSAHNSEEFLSFLDEQISLLKARPPPLAGAFSPKAQTHSA